MRILLSEGNSTSAREAITALGLAGHHLEICDPDAYCLGRYSRFVRRYHRCPGLRDDPQGYVDFIVALLTREGFDVLLPIHEQGYVLAKAAHRLRPLTSLALPAFDSYAQAHSKASFVRILSELGLPYPPTHMVRSKPELLAVTRFPVVVKAAIGTASRGTWMVKTAGDLREAADALDADGGFADDVLVQDLVDGAMEHAQSVFAHGELVAAHVFRQIAKGAGGGPSIKESVERPEVRAHLATFGRRLNWHGALSVDYVFADGKPEYIDCNPRLVESMSAWFAGVDLAKALVDVSLGRATDVPQQGRTGVRTHLAIQALLGLAARTESRLDVLAECRRLLFRRDAFANSCEELTPVRMDWMSAVPVSVTAAWMLINPRAAHVLPKRGFGAHLLTAAGARKVREWSDA